MVSKLLEPGSVPPELEELALELGISPDELQAYLTLEEKTQDSQRARAFQEANQERNLDESQSTHYRMY
jgi:hypothetical protein